MGEARTEYSLRLLNNAHEVISANKVFNSHFARSHAHLIHARIADSYCREVR